MKDKKSNAADVLSSISDLSVSESEVYLKMLSECFNIEENEIVDVLNELQNEHIVTATDIIESILRVQGVSTITDFSLADVSKWSAEIGHVTWESGKTIGNSLKTILTRLSSGHVDISDYTDQKSDVTETLNTLAEKWGTLDDHAKKDLANKVAGRFQAKRFAILMERLGKHD